MIVTTTKSMQQRLESKNNLIIFVLLFSILMINPNISWSASKDIVHWANYNKPLSQTIDIGQNKKSTPQDEIINVNLPAEFIDKHDKFYLVISVTSNVWNRGRNQSDFSDFNPFLKINGGFLKGNYRIPVNPVGPRRQTKQIEIKKSDLKTGLNTIRAYFTWNQQGVFCSGNGCGFSINQIYFKNAPKQTYKLEITSSPLGGKIFMGEYANKIFKGTTPLLLSDLEEGIYYLKIQKKGFKTIEERISIFQNESFTYNLKPDTEKINAQMND